MTIIDQRNTPRQVRSTTIFRSKNSPFLEAPLGELRSLLDLKIAEARGAVFPPPSSLPPDGLSLRAATSLQLEQHSDSDPLVHVAGGAAGGSPLKQAQPAGAGGFQGDRVPLIGGLPPAGTSPSGSPAGASFFPRYLGHNSTRILSREEWVNQLGELTHDHRQAKASRHDRRAGELFAASVADSYASRAYAEASMAGHFDDIDLDALFQAKAVCLRCSEVYSVRPDTCKTCLRRDALVGHDQEQAQEVLPGIGVAPLDPLILKIVSDYRFDLGARAKARKAGLWHRQRASGQRHRIQSVLSCATEGIMEVGCKGCGQQRFFMRTCSSALLCRQCRSRRNQRARARFSRSRLVALALVRRRGLLVGRRRWSEKFLTLTVPHLEGGKTVDAERRVTLLRGAWKRFLRDLNRLVFAPALASGGAKVHWFAAHEWTPGSDSQGHPHLHVWLLCPWLDRELLVSRWRSALDAEGFCWTEGQKTILDVRAAKGRDGRSDSSCANELIKYLVKDLEKTVSEDGHNQFVDPALFARMYVLYDGSRRTQGASGFVSLDAANVESASCQDPRCGAKCGFEVRFLRSAAPEYADALAFAHAAIAERQRVRAAPVAAVS